ncbi:hypothetical protein [Methanimicrococcus hongohii]|uniref:hypothetical protein n=1 Tax=Methanimicrococcus hongohii TaxID=3028295 RepID=UPI00292D33CA|nr:hypothetical protein [Methanimicrococcus sp. Hf6]
MPLSIRFALLPVSAHFNRNPLALNFARFAHKISGCSGKEVVVCSGSQVVVCSGREVFVCSGRVVSASAATYRFPFPPAGQICAAVAAAGSRSSCPPPRAARSIFILFSKITRIFFNIFSS